MQADIEKLKDHLLIHNPFFANGYANVYLDSTAGKFTTIDTKKTVGIQDNLGDYFYIRTAGDYKINDSLNHIGSMPRLDFSTDMVLVALMKDADPEVLMKCLINSLYTFKKCNNPIKVDRALITNERIINSEFRFLNTEEKKQILARLGNKRLVKLTFTMYEKYQINSCKCNPCIKCE